MFTIIDAKDFFYKFKLVEEEKKAEEIRQVLKETTKFLVKTQAFSELRKMEHWNDDYMMEKLKEFLE